MRTFFLAAAFCLFSSASVNQNTVFISTGAKAYAYHRTISCPSLKKCREEGHVKEIALEKAKSMGRTPCKRCYK